MSFIVGTTSSKSDSSFGVNNFETKVASAEKEADETLAFDDFTEIGNNIRDFVVRDLPKHATQLFNVAKATVTPGFITRFRKAKIHIRQVEDTEKALEDLEDTTIQMMKKELAFKKDQRAQDRIVKELLAGKKHLRDEKREVLLKAQVEQVESHFKDFHIRRQQQLNELNVSIQNVTEETVASVERQRKETRIHNIVYYGEQARLWKEESDSRMVAVCDVNQSTLVTRTFNEFESRQFDRTEMQVDISVIGDDRVNLSMGNDLGIYANTAINKAQSTLILEDIDQHEVHMFEPGSIGIEYESVISSYFDDLAQLERAQALYIAIQSETQSLKESIEQLQEMRQILEKDQMQVTQEQLIILNEQQGPPRRLAISQDLPSLDLWKNRFSLNVKRINELQYANDKIEAKRLALDTQAVSVAKSIANLQDKCKHVNMDAKLINGELGLLPSVVGRGLSDVAGLTVQAAKPLQYLNDIRHRSKLTEIKNNMISTVQLHSERKTLDQEIWLNRLDEKGKKGDLENVISRLTTISDRLQQSTVVMTRLNLIDSIKGFLASGLTLAPVHRKLVGLLQWYKYHDRSLSHGIVRYVTTNAMGGLSFENEQTRTVDTETEDSSIFADGITLGHGLVGCCSGVVELPKNTLWSILVTISSKFNVDNNSYFIDPTDFVKVYMGPTLASLGVIGIFFNKVNQLTGTILYDVRYIFRGSHFAFKFDFSSSSPLEKNHLAVCPGIYEEYVMKELEYVNDPKMKGRQRVLSSYVKMLRINETTGILRETKLLEELIAIENVPSVKFWDSSIISQTLQRYSREYFLRILRAEILLQQETGNAAIRFRNSEALTSLNSFIETKLEASKKKYMFKKRNAQRRLLDVGNDMVGKRIILWDTVGCCWRNITIKECRVKWVENGLVALITHIVQEYDDGHNAVGDSMEINLKSFKYFESPIQVVDSQSVARWREKKHWDDSLAAIDVQCCANIAMLENVFNRHKKKEERRLHRARRNATTIFENNIEAQTSDLANSSSSTYILNEILGKVILDEKKGIFKVDPLASKEQRRFFFREEAKRRFIVSHIENQRQMFIQQLALREQSFLKKIEIANNELTLQRNIVLNKRNNDQESIRKLMRFQFIKRKQALLQQVKFDSQLFKTVLPCATHCEHLKTKAWGNNYGKGVKCVTCNKELNDLWKEESQLFGYGSGCDPSFASALVRHRENEQSFRFKTAADLLDVEKERRRLEKERREMEENECYFYDLQDLKAIYDFDHRHARSIKLHGIFRQGLQWTSEELERFEETKRIREMNRLELEGFPESMINKFDPLDSIQEPPPTFRAADERRKSQYNELLFSIGRLHNFSKRIHSFKLIRFELLNEREMYAVVLEALHKDSYIFETLLTELERDLDKTSKLMATFRNMQLLWQQANHIQTQARRDKAKAEMARCGVWESVAECQDQTSMVKDETRSLLRVKLLMDAKLDFQVRTAQYHQRHYSTCKQKFLESEQFLNNLSYCSPGNLVYTRYGQCYVCYYRQTDDMLMVMLPFGRPPAKAYIHCSEIIQLEHAKQTSEMLLMELEDIATSKFVLVERLRMRKERVGMQNEEEGLRQYYEFIDIGTNEIVATNCRITKSVTEAFEISESSVYHKLQARNIASALNKIVQNRVARRKDFIGPPSGRPKSISWMELSMYKTQITLELKQKFIFDAANRAEFLISTSLTESRSRWAQNYVFTQLIDTVILDMIIDVAMEAYSEGQVAKGFAERKSGIMFPQPNWMQYGTYNSLATIWRARKDDLRYRIEIIKGQCDAQSIENKRGEVRHRIASVDVHKSKELRRFQREEKMRQDLSCKHMAQLEIDCRNFYRWELLVNLRERRQMKEEDIFSKQLRRNEIQKQADAKSHYSVVQVKQGQNKTNDSVIEASLSKDFSYENRRQQLKELTLERRKCEEELALMIIEDSLSNGLRDVDRLERQKREFAMEFGVEVDMNNHVSLNTLSFGLGNLDILEIQLNEQDTQNFDKDSVVVEGKYPKWLKLPESFSDWNKIRQNNFIRMMTTIQGKKILNENKIEREFRLLSRLEMRSSREWKRRFRVAEQQHLQSELAMMEADEDLKASETKLIDVRENMMRILMHCRDKGEEELKLRSQLRQLQEIARRRDLDLQDATVWLNLCVRRAKNRDKLKRRVSSDCKWVDTDTVNGFHQRFATELLRENLYFTYFRQIVSSIVNRAEIIATERNLLNLQEKLSVNKAILVDRTLAMKSLLINIRREERMRMRRSFLNELFFSKHRRQVLMERFGSWVRYFLWNRGYKEVYQLKYEVISRHLQLNRRFKDLVKNNTENVDRTAIKTVMGKHRERVIQCNSCFKWYLESQNTSISCQFHPKQFVLDCPRSCPNPGLTDLCVAHRKRRWTCCDSVRQDVLGCSRRYHCPPDSDPIYDRIMEKINERDSDMLHDLDKKWGDALKEDWPLKASFAKRNRIFEIEDSLAENRKTANRFTKLKYI